MDKQPLGTAKCGYGPNGVDSVTGPVQSDVPYEYDHIRYCCVAPCARVRETRNTVRERREQSDCHSEQRRGCDRSAPHVIT